MARKRRFLGGLFDALGRLFAPRPAPAPPPTPEQEAKEFRRLLPPTRRPTPIPRTEKLRREAEKYRPEAGEELPEAGEECYDEEDFDYKHIRGRMYQFASEKEVRAYYKDIPVPVFAFQRCSDSRWLLIVADSDGLLDGKPMPEPRRLARGYTRFARRLESMRPPAPAGFNLSGLLENAPREPVRERQSRIRNLDVDRLKEILGL